MKKKLFVLFAVLIAALTFTHAQSKKDLEEDLIKCSTDKDSVQAALTSLTATYDSISVVCVAYDSMYSAIKEKVFKHDFDPGNMSELIDSLQAESFSGITALNDSISGLHVEIAELKEEIENQVAGSDDQPDAADRLKQLKELLDEDLITQEEYDAKRESLLEEL